jgi:hypothetical protein
VARRAVIIDQWAPLSYKPIVEAGKIPIDLPTWVGSEHVRRLRAYAVLACYRENIAREWLNIDDDEKRRQHREYGDASLIIETIVAAILGVDPKIMVEGAVAPANAPQADRQPDPRAVIVQEWLREWEYAERPMLAITEYEEDAVGLGDGVLVVSWDGRKSRPIVEAYDPEFYFPILDDGNPRAYPERVHIAWEFEEHNPITGQDDKFIRRMTWELIESEPFDVPWSDQPATQQCYMTNVVVPYPGQDTTDVDTLSLAGARYEVNADGLEIRDLPLKIDFIPIVHMPNTIARKQHFGRSSLALVLQLLDELAAADTDLALSARTTGFPPVSVDGQLQTGTDGRTIDSYGPGTVFSGKVDVVDTSASLDALLKYIDFLLKRLSVNSRLPETVLGRGKPTDFKSGYDRSLSFGPMISMIRKMRMVRSEKYPLVFKFVLRLAQLAGEIEAGDLPRTTLEFGRFLPQDRQQVIEAVRTLLEAHAISTVTAVVMLAEEGGLPITDPLNEVTNIQAEDFPGAVALRNATQSVRLAAEYLQLELTEEELEAATRALTKDPKEGEGEDDPDDAEPNQQPAKQPVRSDDE